MAAERFDASGDRDASATLVGLGLELEEAMEELREVAQRIYSQLR